MMIMSFFWKPIIIWIQQLIKQWAKPATQSSISGILSDLTRSRSDLVIENALLRQAVDCTRPAGKATSDYPSRSFLASSARPLYQILETSPSHCSA